MAPFTHTCCSAQAWSVRSATHHQTLRQNRQNQLPHPIRSQFHQFLDNPAADELSLKTRVALTNGSISAMLFLLFHYTPALEFLKFLPLKPADDVLFYCIASDFASTLPPGLRSLREVTVLQDGYRDNWSHLVPFFSLPSLSMFHCIHAFIGDVRIWDDEEDIDQIWDEEEDIDQNLEGRSSAVEMIYMEDCVIGGDALASILRSCRKLRTLRFQHPQLCEYGEGSRFAPPLGDALRQSAQQTLESLKLDFVLPEYRRRNFEEYEYWQSPGLLL